MLMNSIGLTTRLTALRAIGIAHYAVKPLKKRELYGAICATPAFSSMTPAGTFSASLPLPMSEAERQQNGRPLHILIADDSPDNRLLIKAYLRKTAHTMKEADNGQVALDRFFEGNYDLVLMDIQMPILDGYTAVRRIREWETDHQRKRTPIIALTASALDDAVRKAKDAGCDLHVSKPVKKSTLLDAISHSVEIAGRSVNR